MILDSIYESENFGKGWLGYNIMPRAPTAVFVELLICASLVVALVMTPLTQKLVQKLWQQRQITGHAPMFIGEQLHHMSITCLAHVYRELVVSQTPHLYALQAEGTCVRTVRHGVSTVRIVSAQS